MWQIVKAELKYFRFLLIIPMFFAVAFQVIEFYFVKVMQRELLGSGRGYIYILGGFFLFSILQKQFSEKRERFIAILPTTNKQLALARFWFLIIPFSTISIYFVLINSLVKFIWQIEISVPIMHLGIMLIIIAGYILARDDWFSHWNFRKRVQSVFISVLIIQVLAVAFFLNLPDSIKKSTPIIGEYAEILFFLLGLAIMVTTIFSYQKRKSYLS